MVRDHIFRAADTIHFLRCEDVHMMLSRSMVQRSAPAQVRSVPRRIAVGPAVKNGDACTVHYLERLALNDAVVRDSRARKEAHQGDAEREEVPLTFIVGRNSVINGIENAVIGMEVGEVKEDVLVPASDAYGEHRADLTATIPKESCPEGMKVGITVNLSNGLQAVVTDEDPTGFTIDANHPLAGAEMKYTVEVIDNVPSEQIKQVYFGAGCFWGPALRFKRIPGVIDTEVGYCNGQVEKVTYEDVCRGDTGHNEVVRVMYDASAVSLRELLDEFFLNAHDPTALNRQGNDVGQQYRSGCYVESQEELDFVRSVVDELQAKFKGKIVTEVDLVKLYNVAEDYHQGYLEKGGRNGMAQSAAKGCNDPIRCYG